MSTALYRRYRPETFADVIGQEHVTEPLMQALRTGRVNHAYLFSGPRGCGKTTSARILARCLNCEQGPTPTPCGTCDSCVALSRVGAGTVDVIEIDAASHGGVDDARDLRERASYGPAQSRYKIYIIDEAHMVTPQGFNALLKIVEEPPEHVKFIFATTEPEKVIGTIRSRTHHYPFRLVPPARLAEYMQGLCDTEGVSVEPGVLSFVTRAGGGSVRDSLSVLDQLIAGSTDDGVTYAGAAALLGFTDGALLDAIVDALAVGDGAGVFTQIDRVVESGHDPRRFVEDLLERLRDLIIVAAVPDGAEAVLRGLPGDQIERMRSQAGAFGPGRLSYAADIINAGLTEMTGATSPRLQLELMCARVLLPRAAGEDGYGARLDRIERRIEIASTPAPVAESQVSTPGTPSVSAGGEPASGSAPVVEPGEAQAEPVPKPDAAQDDSGVSTRGTSAVSADVPAASGSTPVVEPSGVEAKSASNPGAAQRPPALGVEALRREWPTILQRIASLRRVTWTLISQHAHVADFDGSVLVLSSSSPGLVERIGSEPNPDVVRRAVHDALGLDVRVTARLTGGDGQAAESPSKASTSSGWGPSAEAVTQDPVEDEQAKQAALRSRWQQRVRDAGGATTAATVEPAPQRTEAQPSVPGPEAQRTASADSGALEAQAALSRMQRDDHSGDWSTVSAAAPAWATNDASPADPTPETIDHTPVESMDDEDVEDGAAVGLPVMSEILGATVIEDIRE